MADYTQISWTDHTFNPWIGCQAVSPGCDNCYAEGMATRFYPGHWGAGSSRKILSESNWKKPLTWNRKAEKSGVPARVFCGSMCDWTDSHAPADGLGRLWQTIRDTPNLDWQLLTKRAPNIKKCLPADWGDGYSNVWLGVTVEDRKHGIPRIDILRNTPATIRFLSVEPLLEPLGELDLSGIDWVIVGGESGRGCRRMNPEWALDIQRQCLDQDVAFFFKQHGGSGKDKGGCLLDGLEFKQWPGAQHE